MRNWARTTKVVTRLQSNDLITPVLCTGLDWDGSGICQIAVRRTQQDFVVHLPRVLPDESVVLQVSKAGRSDKFQRNAPYKASFTLHATNQASDFEVPAQCPSFVQQCGGCTFQHLDYGKQVAEKQRLLEELFDIAVENMIPSPNWGYRTRMEFTFHSGSVFAMRRARSIVPLPIDDCPLLPAKARECMRRLPALLQPLNLRPYDIRTARGELQRAVFKTASRGGVTSVLLHLLVTTDDREVHEKLAAACRLANVDEVVVEGPETCQDGSIVHDVVWGDATTSYIVAPKVFFQPNWCLLPHMVAKVCEMVGRGVVWDLYAGAGTIGIRLAQLGCDVHCVDISLRGLAENEKLNDVQVSSYEMNLEYPNFDELPRPDVIVVDPTRDGCSIKLRRWIKASDISRIVYVSCNPRTLHRDALYLADAGFRLKRIVPLDFFPHSPHVEVVALITKD